MTDLSHSADPEERLLVVAPTPRDARITCDILQRSQISCLSCDDLPDLCRRLQAGAGGILITEEAFAGEGAKELLHYLAEQPPWSDLPVLFLTRRGEPSPFTARAVETLGNTLLLERPTKAAMLLSAARAALRERRRQYQTRRHLEMLAEARDAAEDANRAKSEFLANMSHEIRTPMTVFMAAIDHLLQIDRNPERRQLLEMSNQSATRLRSLIDDILDFSRIEARKLEIEEIDFDLRDCVRGAVEMFTLPAQEKNLCLEVEVAEEVPAVVVGDPERLGQVLINLVGNAIKFTSEGEVRVRVQPVGASLEFSVLDTGIGIPEEKRELLFESFSQVDASFTRQYGGTGLGLAISKGLVDLMGGEISVRDREGRGSIFTFALPLKPVDQPSSMASSETEPEDLEEQTATARILLAEDDPMIREMITLMLSRKGWQVDIAETGQEALDKWRSGNFDLILMDLQMPEMSGLEATRMIREREAGEKTVYIIGLTAHARREIKDDCLRAGMDRVLTKPVQVKALYSVIDGCLQE